MADKRGEEQKALDMLNDLIRGMLTVDAHTRSSMAYAISAFVGYVMPLKSPKHEQRMAGDDPLGGM